MSSFTIKYVSNGKIAHLFSNHKIAKDDNIIIAFYVFYHPFVSSWWVFFGYGTNQSDLPYQMKGK
jgi:hypothetical protein